jgi:hypothetical protein
MAGRAWVKLWWGFLAGLYLLTVLIDGLPPSVATPNESILAVLSVSVFLTIFQPSEPGRWRLRWLFPVSAALVALVGELPLAMFEPVSTWIMENAESLGFILLTTLLFGYLSSYPWPQVMPAAPLRVAWMVALVVLPIGVALVNPNGVDAGAAVGVLESAMVWIQRITEAFIAAVLLTIYCEAQARLGGLAESEETLPT